MSSEGVRSEGVVVPKGSAEEVRQFLIRIGALSRSLKPVKRGDSVVFALSRKLNALEVLKLNELGCHLGSFTFERELKSPRSLKEALKGQVPDEVLDMLPSSFDVIGDIAVVRIDEGLLRFGESIANGIMSMNKSIRVVLAEASPVKGEFRLREFIRLGGEERTETVHRENSCVFELDVARTYFSPRLATERLRVASMVGGGSLVIDMFAGVGPFSIEIAKLRGARVIACELNPYAYKYLVRNVKLNRVEKLVDARQGDARDVLSRCDEDADHVIMNYPTGSLDFLDVALRVAKPSCVFHLYTFSDESSDLGYIINKRLSGLDAKAASFVTRTVKEVSPSRRLVAVEFKLER